MRSRAVVSLCTVAILILGLAGCRSTTTVVYDLAQNIDDLRVETPRGGKREGAGAGRVQNQSDGIRQPRDVACWFVALLPDASSRPRLDIECHVPGGGNGEPLSFQVDVEPDAGSPIRAFDATVDAGGAQHREVSLDPWAGRICRIWLRVTGGAPAGLWKRFRLLEKERPAPPHRTEDGRVTALRERLAASNVLIILLDAARPSEIGAYGSTIGATPVVDQIAREGTVFVNAYCNAVYTVASTGSLFTGTYPDVHRVLFMEDRFPPGVLTMAQMASTAGLTTAAFVGNGMAGSHHGFDQGFEHFDELYRHQGYDRLCARQKQWLFPWLEKNANSRFLLYLHFLQPHFGAIPPREFVERFKVPPVAPIDPLLDRHAVNHGKRPLSDADLQYLRSLYRAGLAYADAAVGEVRDELRRLGIWDRTATFVIADHGEALWEHQFLGHNAHVYENMARIPMVVRLPPAAAPAGARVQSLVQTVDIFATLADVWQSEPGRSRTDGRSLLELLAAPDIKRPGIAYTRTVGKQPIYGLRDGRWEYVYSTRYRTEELYDLSVDADERTDLAASRPVLAAWFQQELRRWLRAQEAKAGTGAASVPSQLDEATRQNLKDLGYIDSSSGARDTDDRE